MVGYWDKNLINQFGNKAYSIWFGIPSNDLPGMHIKELLGEEIFKQNLNYINAVLSGIPQIFEREMPCNDGVSSRFTLIQYIPHIIEGIVEGFFVQVSDITSLKDTEFALRKSEERYRLVVQDQTELISRLRGDGTYLFANKTFLDFFGKTEEDLIGSKWNPLVYEEDLSMVNEKILTLTPCNPLVMIENRVYSAQGNVVWMQFSNRGTFDEDSHLVEILSVGRDITQLKKANQALNLASVVYENSLEAIVVTNDKKIILSVNPAFVTISGLTVDEVVGQPLSILKSNYHDDNFYEHVSVAIKEKGFWHGEVWLLNNLKEAYPCLLTITNVVDSSGSIINYVVIFKDNSEFRRLEEKRIFDEKKHRETLIREVHHRIKNNLHGVTGLLSNSIDQNLELEGPLKAAISKVKSIGIIHGLLGNKSSTNIKLMDLLESIVESHEALFEISIGLTSNAEEAEFVIADSESVPMALIINELILNAIKHSSNSDKIEVDLHQFNKDSKAVITICNPCMNQASASNIQQKNGTGLHLIKSLKPKQNFDLEWINQDFKVISKITLLPPIISLSDSFVSKDY